MLANNLLPPQNIEAEEAILGGILLDPDALGRIVDTLTIDAFYVSAHRTIYQAALSLHGQGQPTDLMTISTWLQDHHHLEEVGGIVKLTQLLDQTVSAANIDRCTGQVMEKYLRRQLISAGHEIVELGYDTTQNLDVVLDAAEQKIFGLTQKRPQAGLVAIAETLMQTYADLEKLHEKTASPGIETTFYDLDAMTGGLQRADLIILAGRPSMGKTALGLSMAANIAKKYQFPIAIFSLEMSKEQLALRLLASEARLEGNKLRTGHLSLMDVEKISVALGNLSGLPIYIDDTASITVMQIRSQVRRLQSERKENFGLVLIDYLQLMEGGSENRVQELSKITRSLKGLAREINAPVMALSQLSRGVESRNSKRPMMSDLRESGCLSGDTLIVMADSGKQVPIRELVGLSDFAVWSVNEKTMRMEKGIVTNAFSTGVKPVFTLTTGLGRKIKATSNHKFLTIDGWKRLDELSVGQHICLPRKLKGGSSNSMTYSEAALLGHLIGDGCTLPRHCLQYTTRELDLADHVVALVQDVFGERISPRISPERKWYQVYLSATEQLTHGKRNPVAEWLDSLGVFGLRSHEKFIPEEMFLQHEDLIAHFLRHLWSTDGCIRLLEKDGISRPVAYYATSSEKLAFGVQRLLLILGINALIKRSPQVGKGRNQYPVKINGKPDLESFIEKVGAVGKYKSDSLRQVTDYLSSILGNTNRDIIPKDVWRKYVVPAMKEAGISARKLQSSLGMSYCGNTLYRSNLGRERALNVAKIVRSDELLALANGEVYWDQVRSIKYSGEEPVFDLTVHKFCNFVANNIVVHNSIEQDADLIMMIYRDEYYNADSPDRGIAEILITKHRNGPTGIVKMLFEPEFTQFLNLQADSYS